MDSYGSEQLCFELFFLPIARRAALPADGKQGLHTYIRCGIHAWSNEYYTV